mmetsp:Transcript_28554/g.46857  ORF Transcript_28554/g.46857 Transcript_28554/m.46857 type:complete len:95 (-) Transcript_28554:116-400(-)
MAFYKESYRLAGISYLKYCNICARATRQGLKEPLRSDHILKTDLWRYSWISYSAKNEQTIDTRTNYEDKERLKLEEYVSSNKHILEPKSEGELR